LKAFGIRALKTPARMPAANALCERLVGTFRRECLDYLIPINERHLKSMLKEFVNFYNRGRPQMSGLEFRNHSRIRFRTPAIDTCFLPGIASHRLLCSADCITNIAWKRRLHSVGRHFSDHSHARTIFAQTQ
jgi:hypothetical protein